MSISNHFDALPKMTDDEAIALIIAIKRTHNFVGTVFTPRDVRDHIREYHFAEEDGREPTDAEMDAVFATETALRELLAPDKINHEEVLETGRMVRETFVRLLRTLIPRLDQ